MPAILDWATRIALTSFFVISGMAKLVAPRSARRFVGASWPVLSQHADRLVTAHC